MCSADDVSKDCARATRCTVRQAGPTPWNSACWGPTHPLPSSNRHFGYDPRTLGNGLLAASKASPRPSHPDRPSCCAARPSLRNRERVSLGNPFRERCGLSHPKGPRRPLHLCRASMRRSSPASPRPRPTGGTAEPLGAAPWTAARWVLRRLLVSEAWCSWYSAAQEMCRREWKARGWMQRLAAQGGRRAGAASKGVSVCA